MKDIVLESGCRVTGRPCYLDATPRVAGLLAIRALRGVGGDGNIGGVEGHFRSRWTTWLYTFRLVIGLSLWARGLSAAPDCVCLQCAVDCRNLLASHLEDRVRVE